MLGPDQRLRRREEFAATIRGGRRAGRGGLVVHLAERVTPVQHQAVVDNPPATARAGFVVPKAVGNAVVRNKVRRRLRHALRDRLGQLGGVDLVVRVAPAAANRPYPSLVADLDSAIRAAQGRQSSSSKPRR